MAIVFDGTGGFFTRMGRILRMAYLADVYEATLPANWTSMFNQFLTTLPQVQAPTTLESDSLTRVASGIMSFAANMASDLLTQTVLADQPSQAGTPTSCMQEIIRQMIAQGKTVQACTVSSTATALTGNIGTGVIILSTKRGDGLVQENTVAETLRVVCVADSYTGGAAAGSEQFSLVGAPASAGTWDYDYPNGSGANSGTTVISADVDASDSANLLTNSDFEEWTTATPADTLDFWTLLVGTWGTDIRKYSASPMSGLYAVEFVAGTGVNTSLYQVFNDAELGTSADPSALTSYSVNLYLKRLGVVSAGVLTVELVDSTGTVVNDAQSVANTTTITLSGITTAFVSYPVVFRLPANPPTALWLRMRMSTALAGANVVMDNVTFGPLTAMYAGGPGFAILAGATPFVGGDGWSIANANNYGGASYVATFQIGANRLYGMTTLGSGGLLLPSSGSPNIADTLITT